MTIATLLGAPVSRPAFAGMAETVVAVLGTLDISAMCKLRLSPSNSRNNERQIYRIPVL
jgi:hypothetical protein